ncbi:MAG: GTPase ObgE [Phycisphaerales bacterium JB043]
MFADHAVIYVRAGDGGDGCLSFRREKFVPKGGPDGGDGGDGGSVVLVEDPNVQTLLDFRGQHHWAAKNGEPGRGKDMHGANGTDIELRLPAGTMVYVKPWTPHDRTQDDEVESTSPSEDSSLRLVCDLRRGERVVLAGGGRGGFGNAHFKSPTNQTPRETTPGGSGEAWEVHLELKLMADVGLVGMPNAGKSTFLRSISRATPKVADYPFTTLVPQLGIAALDPERRIVVADIPGLIEGAAEGAGLGHDFLRHIERTRVLVHLIEIEPSDGSDPAENYASIRRELETYSEELASKPEVLVLSKMDLLGDISNVEEAIAMVREMLGIRSEQRVLGISSITSQGVREVLEACWDLLDVKMEGWRESPYRR